MDYFDSGKIWAGMYIVKMAQRFSQSGAKKSKNINDKLKELQKQKEYRKNQDKQLLRQKNQESLVKKYQRRGRKLPPLNKNADQKKLESQRMMNKASGKSLGKEKELRDTERSTWWKGDGDNKKMMQWIFKEDAKTKGPQNNRNGEQKERRVSLF
mmetsp:Transcript_1731/g.1651  ORF Transcript_1731/g.1651 Transcript_1731/m.1651 type:complete len:155 (-) Transcript_1731:100-564(-)